MEVSDYKTLYVSETSEILQALEEGVMSLESGCDRKACVEEIFRNAHNLKGMSGAMGYDKVVDASHAMENILDMCRKGKIEISGPEAELLLRVIDLLGELVRWTVSEEQGGRGDDILGEILVLLSPMSIYAAREQETSCAAPRVQAEGAPVLEQAEIPEPEASPEEGAERVDKYPGKAEVARTRITSTRVDLGKLDTLMDLVGELIINRIRLSSLARELGSKYLYEELASSGRLISEIQKEVMEARLVPAGQVFHRFKRLARDTAKELGKKVQFDIAGAEIGLDRTVLESMVDPLVHLIRNSIDHGIESPDERTACGKPAAGNVVLSAKRERNFVIIEIRDDGRGIDFERIRAKQIESGANPDSIKSMGREELCRILTAPGFSTREDVSRYSGRGVGMNIVKETIDSLGGSMSISSECGKGTVISMNLPINLSITKALLFCVGEDIHAIPIEYVKETTRVEHGSFRTIRGRDMLDTTGGPIPVVRPDEIFKLDLDRSESRYIKVIIVDTGGESAGLVVNRILGQQDVVIKGLPSMIRGLAGISGATILGSGKIAFIWDPRVLFHGRSTHESDKEAVVLEN